MYSIYETNHQSRFDAGYRMLGALILFLDYAAAQLRQYHRLTKQIKPDMETYERLREKQ